MNRLWELLGIPNYLQLAKPSIGVGTLSCLSKAFTIRGHQRMALVVSGKLEKLPSASYSCSMGRKPSWQLRVPTKQTEISTSGVRSCLS